MEEERNLTQEQMAKTVKTSKNSHSTPPHETLVAIADVFVISIDYLLGRADDQTPPDPKPIAFPPLSPKDERDIGRDLKNGLDNESKELLLISFETNKKTVNSNCGAQK